MTDAHVTHIDSYIYRRNQKGNLSYLLLKRQPKKKYANLWQGVAGKIEYGETAVDAVLREIFEETGLKPLNLYIADHLTSFYQSYNDKINFVPVFMAEVDSKEVRISEEHCDYRWVNFENGLRILSWNQQKKALSAINTMLQSEDGRLEWSKVKLDQEEILGDTK